MEYYKYSKTRLSRHFSDQYFHVDFATYAYKSPFSATYSVCRRFGDLYVYIALLATYALFMFDILNTNQVTASSFTG